MTLPLPDPGRRLGLHNRGGDDLRVARECPGAPQHHEPHPLRVAADPAAGGGAGEPQAGLHHPPGGEVYQPLVRAPGQVLIGKEGVETPSF